MFLCMLLCHFESLVHALHFMKFFLIQRLCCVILFSEASTGLFIPDKELTTNQSNDSTWVCRAETFEFASVPCRSTGEQRLKGAAMTQMQLHDGKPTPALVMAHKSSKPHSLSRLAGTSTGLSVSSLQQHYLDNPEGLLGIWYISGSSWDFLVVDSQILSSLLAGENVSTWEIATQHM